MMRSNKRKIGYSGKTCFDAADFLNWKIKSIKAYSVSCFW